MGKQLVNLVGLVVVIAVVVAGTLLIGLPMISQSFVTGAQAAQVDQANLGTAAQVAGLEKEKKDLDALTATVNALQRQIPAVNKQDDVFEIVASASTATGVTVQSVKADVPESWTARTTIESADGSTADGASSASTAAGAGTTATPAPTPAPSTSAAPSTTATPAPTPEQQIPFEIIVEVPNAAAAAAFVDALGKGPRLLGIVHAALDDSQSKLLLTVNALAFVRTAN
jgi:hypothetical protein